MATIGDLVDLLSSAGFTVAPPGDNTTALPCVVLSPVALDPEHGNRHLYHVIDILPTVAATPWEQQHDAAASYTVDVMRALTGTQYQYIDRFPFEADTDRAVPAIYYRINVRFAGPDLCPPTP